jgi:hypothetical protein
MSSILKFTPIVAPIKDIITGEVINIGYHLSVPFELFQQNKFNAKLKLYCPNFDFIKNSVMLHAWIVNKEGRFINKETHISSIQWIEDMKFNQASAMYWPNIDQEVMQSFKYDLFMIVQPIVASGTPEFVLEIEEAN